ncbi:hypothetical protein [Streptomyces flavidovirens]|uniref:hypothetical protein n=1 Tax=Streptomyces flavidovirens TaxID=67298 RepID=UPI0005634266|nr:hypothetical protein [Streptomyces flavidovirens]
MTPRAAAVAVLRVVGALCVLAASLCTLLLTSPSASACDVSYRYTPEIKFGGSGLGGVKPCSAGTSLTGTAILALLAASALAAAGTIAFRKGRETAETFDGQEDPLSGYLHPTEHGTRGHDADTSL